MRKFLIVIVVLVVVLLGGLVLAVMNVNALLEENRGELARLASEAVGRDVSFEKAEVAFPGRLSVAIRGLRIAEDPGFGKGDFLELDSAFVAVEILPALQRRLELTGVRLDRPTIRVIQTKKGFNFSSLGASKEGSKKAASDAGTPGGAPQGEASGSMALAISGFRIQDATILFEDRTAKPPLALTIEKFESSGTDLFGSGPFDIAFGGLMRPTKGDAALASPIKGKVHVADLGSGAADIRLESSSFHPLLLGLDFDKGKAVEHLDGVELDVSLPANSAKSGYPIELRSSAGRLGGFDFKTLDTTLLYRGSKLDIRNFVVGLAGGTVGLTGDVTFGPPGRSPFKLDTKLANLDSGELAAVLLDVPKGYVTGRLGGEVDLRGDSLEWERLKRSLAGKIDLQVGEGALEQVNVLDRLVTQLVQDPGLGQLAANSIRDVAPQALSRNRTVFENVNLALKVANGALEANDIELHAGDFMISAAGLLGLDGAVSGKGKIRFSQDLSARILKKADNLAPLLGSGDIVELPLVFGGTTSSVKLQPDLAALTAIARGNATAELRQEAGQKLSDAIFGKKKKEPVEGEAPTQKDRDREAAENLINRGLGQLLGK